MKTREKRRILAAVILAGMIMIAMVVLTAFAAEIRQENNQLMTKNKALQGEVDTLNVKIKAANSVDHIEQIATQKYGMVHPSQDQCVYITSKDQPGQNFASVIRKEAYN